MRVYFISGMAADERVFRHIELPEEFTPVNIPWITPEPNESLSSYSLRMAEGIDTSEAFVVIGLSMGGMIATEIGLRYPQSTVILISSVPVYRELPLLYRFAGRTGLYHLVPASSLKTAAYLKRFFTAETSDQKRMLRKMIVQTDPRFIKWSMSAILRWRNNALPAKLFHIHGERDFILPCRYTHPQMIIKGAGHLMVMDRYRDINTWLQSILLSLKVSA